MKKEEYLQAIEGYYIIAEIMICAIGVAISMALLNASRSKIQVNSYSCTGRIGTVKQDIDWFAKT